MNFKQIFRKTIQIILPLALGLVLLWVLYRDQDWDKMMADIKTADYRILLFSLIFGLFANTVRGVRWGMLIDSLGQRVKRKNTVCAVLGNYAINLAIPFRAGEIWRCGIIAKYEKVPFSKLLGTLFVDRIMDTFMVGLITLSLCVFNLSFFRNFFAENPPAVIETLYTIISSVWTYIIIIVLALLVWFVFTKMKHLHFIQKASSLISNVWEGIKSLWKIEHKMRFIIQTILIWGGYFLYFYTTFFAFDFTKDLGIVIGLLAFAMSSIGVAAPVQGGIGVWHFMVIFTLVTFGVNDTDAKTFAFVVFAIQNAWMVLTGLFAIVALPILNREKIQHETVKTQNYDRRN